MNIYKNIQNTMKEKIITYLKDKDLFHETDMVLINEIEFNIELLKSTKEDIRENGWQRNITRDPDKEDFFQKSRAVDVYQQALKNIQALFRQLILTPAERHKMKIELMNAIDEFDQIFEK